MNPNFSFKYNGTLYDYSFFENNKCVIDDTLTVTVGVMDYSEYNAYGWLLYFENTGTKNSGILSDICDCDALLRLDLPPGPMPGYRPTDGGLCVITMNGMVEGKYYWENDKVSATEYGFNYEYLDKAPNRTKSFCNVGGRSSEGMMPFFDVTTKGNGYITAIGWTGDWKAEFAGCDNGVQVKTGLKETCFYLKPGEKIRTSSVLIMEYQNDDDKHNKFRRLIKNHFSHKSNTDSDRDGLFALEIWGGLNSEEIKKRVREIKEHNISFEDVWMDAG